MKMGSGPNKHLDSWEVAAFPSAWNTNIIVLKHTCFREEQGQAHVFFLPEVITAPGTTSLELLHLSKTFFHNEKRQLSYWAWIFLKHHRVNNNKTAHSINAEVDWLLPGSNHSMREGSLALWEPSWDLLASAFKLCTHASSPTVPKKLPLIIADLWP